MLAVDDFVPPSIANTSISSAADVMLWLNPILQTGRLP